MQKDEVTGIVSNEGFSQSCIGCWMCVMVCPYGVISPKRDGDRKVAVKCDLCKTTGEHACVKACPSGAVVCMDESEVDLGKRGGIYL
jgi:carbon-monoxide dehydrogenase iron sulfur subunit